MHVRSDSKQKASSERILEVLEEEKSEQTSTLKDNNLIDLKSLKNGISTPKF